MISPRSAASRAARGALSHTFVEHDWRIVIVSGSAFCRCGGDSFGRATLVKHGSPGQWFAHAVGERVLGGSRDSSISFDDGRIGRIDWPIGSVTGYTLARHL